MTLAAASSRNADASSNESGARCQQLAVRIGHVRVAVAYTDYVVHHCPSQCTCLILLSCACTHVHHARQALSLAVAGIRGDVAVVGAAPRPVVVPTPSTSTASLTSTIPASTIPVDEREKQRGLWRWRNATRRADEATTTSGAHAAGLALLLDRKSVV